VDFFASSLCFFFSLWLFFVFLRVKGGWPPLYGRMTRAGGVPLCLLHGKGTTWGR